MKWWVAGTAGTALILAGVSILIASDASAPVIDARIPYVTSTFSALLAAGLSSIDAAHRSHKIRALSLAILMGIVSIISNLRIFPQLDVLNRGPFCSDFIDVNYVCAHSAALGVDVFYLGPIVILAIAALLSTFWPSKQNPAIATE